MGRIFKHINFHAILVIIMVYLAMFARTSLASSLEEQKKALNLIANFAERFCKDIPLEGHGKNIELTGKAKAELTGVINKLVNIGIEGSGKYQDQKYKGVLQKDLVRAFKESTDCKLQIWKDLKDRLLPKNIGTLENVNSDKTTVKETPIESLSEIILHEDNYDIHNYPEATDTTGSTTYIDGGFVLKNTQEGGKKDWEYFYRITTAGLFPSHVKIEIECRLTKGPFNGRYGLLFGCDKNYGNCYGLVVLGVGTYELIQWRSNKGEILLSLSNPAVVNVGTHRINRLRVDIQGDTFTYYINGTRLGTQKTHEDIHGYLGFLVAKTGNEVFFDNLKVTSISK